MAIQSEVAARINGQSTDQLDLGVIRELCPGCDGRCGMFALLPPADSSIRVSKKHLDLTGCPAVGESVTVAVSSSTLISLSSLVYLTPLVLMLLSMVACFWFYSRSDAALAIWAVSGLLAGLVAVQHIVRWLEQKHLTGTISIKAR